MHIPFLTDEMENCQKVWSLWDVAKKTNHVDPTNWHVHFRHASLHILTSTGNPGSKIRLTLIKTDRSAELYWIS